MAPEANGVNGASSRGHYIVVGAGFGGLAAAIELVRKGISVEVLESVQKLTLQGTHVASAVSTG
jgi:monoamine oxidase